MEGTWFNISSMGATGQLSYLAVSKECGGAEESQGLLPDVFFRRQGALDLLTAGWGLALSGAGI